MDSGNCKRSHFRGPLLIRCRLSLEGVTAPNDTATGPLESPNARDPARQSGCAQISTASALITLILWIKKLIISLTNRLNSYGNTLRDVCGIEQEHLVLLFVLLFFNSFEYSIFKLLNEIETNVTRLFVFELLKKIIMWPKSSTSFRDFKLWSHFSQKGNLITSYF